VIKKNLRFFVENRQSNNSIPRKSILFSSLAPLKVLDWIIQSGLLWKLCIVQHVYIRICVTWANVDKQYAITSDYAGNYPVIIW